jgi:spore germination cell wall hydrolase CwlJ-like protein
MTTTLKSAALPAIICCALLPFADLSAKQTASTSRQSVTIILAPPTPYSAPVQTPSPARTAESLRELVEDHASIKPKSASADCLARAVYFEGRSEPLEGQLAVAEVVLNRVGHKSFEDTICGVVREPDQFSFVRKGVLPDPDISTKAWRRAVAIAHIALKGLRASRASDALYYHADYVAPDWRHAFVEKAKLGAHIFYTEA